MFTRRRINSKKEEAKEQMQMQKQAEADFLLGKREDPA